MRFRAVLAGVVALAVFLCAGLWLGGHPGSLPSFAREAFVEEPSGLTAEAAKVLQDNYYRPVGTEELGNASLQGMVRELRRRHGDKFTEYFSPENLEAFNQEIEGHFSGIGMTVVPDKKGLKIEGVFPRSPAAEAGLEAGDLIISVNGKAIAGETSNEATEKIKGPEGTQVTIGFVDAKTGKTRKETLTRAEVALPNVSHKLETVGGTKLGYVRMLSFSEGVHVALAEAVKKVTEEGAEGIVLDLRHNPGGLLEEAVASAGIFLPDDEVVVSTNSRTQGHSVHKTAGEPIAAEVPMVVLIDGGTASAAEILTAALIDDRQATAVGETSYGKGVFQEEHGLANGGALKMTVGEYFTPDGENLARTHGIHPEVVVALKPGAKVDTQKAKALQVLRRQVAG